MHRASQLAVLKKQDSENGFPRRGDPADRKSLNILAICSHIYIYICIAISVNKYRPFLSGVISLWGIQNQGLHSLRWEMPALSAWCSLPFGNTKSGFSFLQVLRLLLWRQLLSVCSFLICIISLLFALLKYTMCIIEMHNLHYLHH
jgi:hypothetical protein